MHGRNPGKMTDSAKVITFNTVSRERQKMMLGIEIFLWEVIRKSTVNKGQVVRQTYTRAFFTGQVSKDLSHQCFPGTEGNTRTNGRFPLYIRDLLQKGNFHLAFMASLLSAVF